MDIRPFVCRDLRHASLLHNQAMTRETHTLYSGQHAYITLKESKHNMAEGQRETETYYHLSFHRIDDYAGATLIRKILDSFQISTAEGGL